MIPIDPKETPWHLSRNFTVSNVMAGVAVVVGGIIAFNTLEGNVTINAKEIVDITESVDSQKGYIKDNEKSIQELKTQTAVIKNNQKQQTMDIADIKDDIKTILNEVRK